MSPNARGAAFMVLSMGAFALEDALLKHAFEHLPRGFAFTLFALIGMGTCLALSARKGERLFPAEFVSRGLMIRSGIEIGGRLFYTLSIAFVSLSLTSVILQAAPLVVTLGAAILFGEKVGARRWIAMLIGFAGVVLILRPAPEHFDPLVVLPVLGMLGFALRDLATRASPPHVTTAQLGTLGFMASSVAGLIIWSFDPALPNAAPLSAWSAVLIAGLIGTLAYNTLSMAMRAGDVGAVAPFRYSRLLFALALAFVLFDERPDALTLMGGALVVVTGLYTLLGRAQRPHRQPPENAA